jgi:voltage-gated potassium channel
MRLFLKRTKLEITKLKDLIEKHIVYIILLIISILCAYSSFRFSHFNIISIFLAFSFFIGLKLKIKNILKQYFLPILSVQLFQVSTDLIEISFAPVQSYNVYRAPIQFYPDMFVPLILLIIFLIKPNIFSIISIFLISLFRIFYIAVILCLQYAYFIIEYKMLDHWGGNHIEESFVEFLSKTNLIYLLGPKLLICGATILIFIFIQKQNRIILGSFKIKDNLKKILCTIVALSYLFSWLYFGFIYRDIATFSQGDAFATNGEIRSKNNLRTLHSYFPNISYGILKNLIKFQAENDDTTNDNFKIHLGNTLDAKDAYYFQDKDIGSEWAAFYYEYFRNSLKASHFSLKKEKNLFDLPEKEVLPNGTTRVVLGPPFLPKGIKNYFQYKLILYKPLNPKTTQEISSANDLAVICSYPIWFEEPADSFAEIYNISDLYMILEKARNYLDDTVEIMNKIQSGEIRYPYTDFLYFSAITITTLGYGDILPNSNTVRFLVMMEALLGILLAGFFISCLFIKNENGK